MDKTSTLTKLIREAKEVSKSAVALIIAIENYEKEKEEFDSLFRRK